MERLRTEQPRGLNRAGIRKWAMICVLLGVFGRSILQTWYLGLSDMTGQELLQAMEIGPDVMLIVTVAIVLQFLETCAVPLYCLLLAEGFIHTSDPMKYLGRIAGVAFLSEIPFNFAMSGLILDFSTRNPAFGLMIAAALLYLYCQFREKKASHWLVKIAVTFAAVIWCGMLRVEQGIPCLVITLAFWCFRKKPMIRNLIAGVAAMLCSLYSVFYMVAPMSILLVQFYNGEKGEENRKASYLFYPAALTIFCVIGCLVF